MNEQEGLFNAVEQSTQHLLVASDPST